LGDRQAVCLVETISDPAVFFLRQNLHIMASKPMKFVEIPVAKSICWPSDPMTIVYGWGSTPDPAGEASTDPLVGWEDSGVRSEAIYMRGGHFPAQSAGKNLGFCPQSIR